MLALVLVEHALLDLNHPAPPRPSGEARIVMRKAGICDTDLQLAKGYMGYRGVLGHEFVGEVVECDTNSWLGKRVVADINAGCGMCNDCQDRDGHHCSARTVLGIVGRGGALAEELVVPERTLVEVPDTVTDDQAVFAEPLAAALHVLQLIRPDTRNAIVLGDGKLGVLIAMSLAQAGIATTLVGHHREKLALAEGASAILESAMPESLASSFVVEATGTAAGLGLAMRLCEPRGTLVLKSTVADPHKLDLSPVVINELTVVGSRCGDMQAAVTCLAEGRVDPRPLIAARYALSDAELALEHAGRPGALKILVEG